MSMTIQRIYDVENELSNAMNAASDKAVTRDVMASFYADCLLADSQARCAGKPGVDWLTLNKAIIARWPRGIAYIKKLAWGEARTGKPAFIKGTAAALRPESEREG